MQREDIIIEANYDNCPGVLKYNTVRLFSVMHGILTFTLWSITPDESISHGVLLTGSDCGPHSSVPMSTDSTT